MPCNHTKLPALEVTSTVGTHRRSYVKNVGQFEWVSILPEGLSHKGEQHSTKHNLSFLTPITLILHHVSG